ncbi:MAG: hypothetical protein EA349_05805 [Halomonadaceae bacterium]|nr:MAG: hypothetical protein EA349_05805 [Halomonadaceae bacterium]
MNGKTIVLFLLGFMVTGCATTNQPAQTDASFYEQLFLLNDVPAKNGASEQPRLAVRPLPLTIRRPASTTPAQTPAEPPQSAQAQPEPAAMRVAQQRAPRPLSMLAFGDYPHRTLRPENHPPLTEQEMHYIQAQLARLQQAGENTEKYQAEIARGKTEGGVMAWFYRRWVPY